MRVVLHGCWWLEGSPLAEPQQEWKNNRKAGPQETGAYDIRLVWGFWAYLSLAAAVTITDMKLRCRIARPTLWGGHFHINGRNRWGWGCLLSGWPEIVEPLLFGVNRCVKWARTQEKGWLNHFLYVLKKCGFVAPRVRDRRERSKTIVYFHITLFLSLSIPNLESEDVSYELIRYRFTRFSCCCMTS